MKTMKNKLALALIAAGLSFGVMAADITVAYDADPVSMDPHEQLAGATLQLSHMVFDPLIRFTQKWNLNLVWQNLGSVWITKPCVSLCAKA